jgi:hypothetical protein
MPVAERIAFVNNSGDKLAVAIANLKPDYEKRGNVDLTITTTIAKKPVQGSFSIAITNTAAITPDLENETNIFTSLLLTSDLVGYIEKPNHYFLNNDLKTRIELDNLLLTQGWRKINWKNVSDSQFPAIVYPAEKTMQISGRITKSGKPVANGKVVLFSNSGGFFTTDTISDINGRFNFTDVMFSDSVKFIVQARTSKENKNVEINLDVLPNQIVTTNKNTGDIEVNVNESILSYLDQSDKYFNEQVKKGLLNRTIMLDEVKIVQQKNPAPNSSNLNGAGRAVAVFTAKDLENSFSLSQYLGGRVAGVTVRNGKAYSLRAGGGAMGIVLDGMNMSEFNMDDINVMDIESVEVLRSIGNTAIYGSNGSNGLLVITTKRGAGTENNYNRYAPGIVTYSPKGFYQARQFYSPKYDANPDTKPDFRTTVYWNPHLVSDATGKANINYFNTDQAGNYRIVIEGIDVDGNLARQVVNYQVN